MDGQGRTVLVETRTFGNDLSPEWLIPYQLGNHLGSVLIELDQQAKLLSYEEYSPFGNSTYRAASTKTPKRYRYTQRNWIKKVDYIATVRGITFAGSVDEPAATLRIC